MSKLYVNNCTDCKNGSCSNPDHSNEHLHTIACDNGFCQYKGPTAAIRQDSAGSLYAACEIHLPYLAGWVRDAEYEGQADSKASRHYEESAYGSDYDY